MSSLLYGADAGVPRVHSCFSIVFLSLLLSGTIIFGELGMGIYDLAKN
jgi:hypothetical protein